MTNLLASGGSAWCTNSTNCNNTLIVIITCAHACADNYYHVTIHAHMHTCTQAHMHTCTHAHMHTGTHAHMHTGTHAHMHTGTQAHTCLLREVADGRFGAYQSALRQLRRPHLLRPNTRGSTPPSATDC